MNDEHKHHDFSQTPKAADSPLNALIAAGIPWPRKPLGKPTGKGTPRSSRSSRTGRSHRKAMQ